MARPQTATRGRQLHASRQTPKLSLLAEAMLALPPARRFVHKTQTVAHPHLHASEVLEGVAPPSVHLGLYGLTVLRLLRLPENRLLRLELCAVHAALPMAKTAREGTRSGSPVEAGSRVVDNIPGISP